MRQFFLYLQWNLKKTLEQSNTWDTLTSQLQAHMWHARAHTYVHIHERKHTPTPHACMHAYTHSHLHTKNHCFFFRNLKFHANAIIRRMIAFAWNFKLRKKKNSGSLCVFSSTSRALLPGKNYAPCLRTVIYKFHLQQKVRYNFFNFWHYRPAKITILPRNSGKLWIMLKFAWIFFFQTKNLFSVIEHP